MKTPIDYIEFKATDLEKTKTFYHEVFGWEFTDYGPNYVSFSEVGIAGGFELSAENPLRMVHLWYFIIATLKPSRKK